MVSQARTLRYKPYREADADDWLWLIWGLNADTQSDWPHAAKRVSKLLLNMKELDRIREELALSVSEPRVFDLSNGHAWPSFSFQKHELKTLSRRGGRLAADVNRQLRFYRWSPGITVPRFEETFRERPQWNARSEADYQEKLAISFLLEELHQGRINRFRVCRQCQLWFYAVTHHQISCTDSCRKKFASTADEFKAKRREYMKAYRKAELARNKKAKFQVKAKRKTR